VIGKARGHQTIQIQDAPKYSPVGSKMAVDPPIRHDESQEQSTPAQLYVNVTDTMHTGARTSTLNNDGGAGRDSRLSPRKIGAAPKFANFGNLTNAISATVSAAYRTADAYGASPTTPTEGLVMGGITSNKGSPSKIPRASRECSKPVAAIVAEAGPGESPMEVDVVTSQPVRQEATKHYEVSIYITVGFRAHSMSIKFRAAALSGYSLFFRQLSPSVI
jgi:hypothetical protein